MCVSLEALIPSGSSYNLLFPLLPPSLQLQELEEKYSECIEMLHEAQEELKNLRNRNYPAGTPRRFHPLGLYPMVCALTCVIVWCVYSIFLYY